jgi:hypothetical protein
MIAHLLSALVLVASGAYCVWLTVLVFAKPAVAERFFMSFASSARTHFIEQIGRLLVGASLVIYSSDMWQSDVFRLIGWVIVVSAVALMIFPWQWHQRFGKTILPTFIKYMRLYAIAALAFGALILYAVLAPHLNGSI